MTDVLVGGTKPLFIPLATEPYRRFESREKTVEVRQYGRAWTERTVWTGRRATLSRGYSTPDRLHGFVGQVAVAPRLVDTPLWVKRGAALQDVQRTDRYRVGEPGPKTYFDPDRPVLAFEVVLP